MQSKERKSRFTIRKTYTVEPIPLADRQTAERILAKLVAEAYVADYPELFGPAQGQGESDSEGGGKSACKEGEQDEGSTE